MRFSTASRRSKARRARQTRNRSRRTDFQSVLLPTRRIGNPSYGKRPAPPSAEQAALEHLAGPVEGRLPEDLRRTVGHAVAELFERVAGHVRALVAAAADAGHRVEAV